jgi:MOSC domain-containing protein YiiM
MFQGELVAVCIGPHTAEALQAVEQVEAVAGRGLIGDRYYHGEGTFAKKDSPDREVTLIESEALEALTRDCEISLRPDQTRRNLITRGVPLNHLVGKEFSIGEVVLRGLRLCEPCGHLERLTTKGVEKGLLHRGGLRAQILRGGTLRPGAVIRPAACASPEKDLSGLPKA